MVTRLTKTEELQVVDLNFQLQFVLLGGIIHAKVEQIPEKFPVDPGDSQMIMNQWRMLE